VGVRKGQRDHRSARPWQAKELSGA
jgi:hypothetical protein